MANHRAGATLSAPPPPGAGECIFPDSPPPGGGGADSVAPALWFASDCLDLILEPEQAQWT